MSLTGILEGFDPGFSRLNEQQKWYRKSLFVCDLVDQKRVWRLQEFGLIMLILRRIFGCYRNSHLGYVSKSLRAEIVIDGANPHLWKMNELVQGLWKKCYKKEVFPGYTILPNEVGPGIKIVEMVEPKPVVEKVEPEPVVKIEPKLEVKVEPTFEVKVEPKPEVKVKTKKKKRSIWKRIFSKKKKAKVKTKSRKFARGWIFNAKT